MKRISVHLPAPLLARLKAHAKQTGLSVAEILRAAVAEGLEQKRDTKRKGE